MSVRSTARFGSLAAGALLLAHCSAANKLDTNSKYSAKMVEDGEPVPKGGGRYSLGQPYNINGRTYYPAENAAYRAEGVASWYGPDFHGRQTANGEVYDMHSISAAHPTMPLPSHARVTNLDNGRSIAVRVNDRGPYARNRIIDLSIGAAKALDFYGQGLARVRVEYIGRAPLEGSDDRMLMATLRHGGPAPAPSRLMIASTTPLLPFIPRHVDRRGSEGEAAETPLPPDRPFSLGAPPPSRTTERNPQPEGAPAGRTSVRSVVRVPAPVADGALGLMSGRGLY